jgi:hypothetical protein
VSPEIKGRRIGRKSPDYDHDPELAQKVLRALLSQPLWITRTVESVSLVDRHTARRKISRHYEIPESRLRPMLKGTELMRLPVFAISKGQFLSCDLIDESKHYVSLPPLPDRAELSANALVQFAELLGAKREAVAPKIHQFATAGPLTCYYKLANAKKDSDLESLFQHRHFAYLANYLAGNYVVYIDVQGGKQSESTRRIIRFELDVRFPHTFRELDELREIAKDRPGYGAAVAWPRNPSFVDRWLPRRARSLLRRFGLMSHRYRHYVPVDGAGSLHLDVEAAEGIAFARRKLRFRGADRIVHSREAQGASSRRARFLIPRGSGRGWAVATIYFRPAPGLLRNGAPLLLIGFAALLYGSFINYSHFAGASVSVPLLFLIPGLVSVVTVRPNEHPFVSSVLGAPRILAITPIPLGILAAYVLMVEGSKCILWAEAVVAAIFGVVLLLGRIVDELKIKPALSEYLEDDLTRIG